MEKPKHCKHCGNGFSAAGDYCGKCKEEGETNRAHWTAVRLVNCPCSDVNCPGYTAERKE